MIKNSVLGLLLLLCFKVSASTTNAVINQRFQWSTNDGGNWNEDIQVNSNFLDVVVLPEECEGPACFFKASPVANGDLDAWHIFIVTTYAGTNVEDISIPVYTNTFYVYPNSADGYGTNIIYRVVMTITNLSSPNFGEPNTNSVASTNLPPPP